MSMRADSVIIVGGGIIGIACAHYLCHAGFRVTVIDKSRIAGACSHANCGFVCPSHVLPLNRPGAIFDGLKSLLNPKAPFSVRPQMRLGLYRWFLEFARRCSVEKMLCIGNQLLPLLESSMHEYRTLLASREFDCDWQQNGLLYVLRSRSARNQFAKEDELLTRNYGVSARRLNSDELADFESGLKSGLAGGFFYADEASVRPDTLARAWQSHLERQGVEFISHCGLEQVRVADGRIVELETSTGDLTAEHYVFATGAWSGQLGKILGCHIPIEPGKGYSVTLRKPDECPSHSMLFPEHRIGVTPFSDRLRIGSMMEFSGFDTRIPEHRISQLLQSAKPYLKSTVGPPFMETWFGWRPMTWDSLPIIGRLPNIANGLLATGHNMLGLTLAPATGRLICELMLERTTHIDSAAFAPDRF